MRGCPLVGGSIIGDSTVLPSYHYRHFGLDGQTQVVWTAQF